MDGSSLWDRDIEMGGYLAVDAAMTDHSAQIIRRDSRDGHGGGGGAGVDGPVVVVAAMQEPVAM